MTTWQWRLIVLATMLVVAAGAWTIRWSQSCPPGYYCMHVVCPEGYRCMTDWRFGQSVLVEKSVTITPLPGSLGTKGQ